MEYTNAWNCLRSRKTNSEEALELIRIAYSERPNASHSMELGVALLWLDRYSEAYDHFRSSIETSPRSGDNDYGMAGVAKWCLGKPEQAVTEWQAGLEAKYARGSGLGVRMPFLLFFASLLRPQVIDRRSVTPLIAKKAKDRRIENWPNPIAKLILGQIDEAELQSYCKGNSHQDTGNRQWLTSFYASLVKLEQGTLSEFKNSMRELADTNNPAWQDENVFTSRIWTEEFFLARHEAK